MISQFEKNVIAIIKASLDAGVPCIDGEMDYEKLYELSKQMQITPLICYGLEGVFGVFDTPIGKKLLKSTLTYSYLDEAQNGEIEKISSAFNKENVDYLLLKGCVLKKLYPRTEMRLMSDADILIKDEQYSKIEKIMKDLGFESELESDHEYIWHKGSVNIELHKRLIPSYNKDYYSYFGNGWRLAVPTGNGSEYVMRDEDHFIYDFVHYAKHYRDGGIGIKHVCDLYLLTKNTSLDWNYIEEELKKLSLVRFWHNTKDLIQTWFCDKQCSEVSAFLTHKIFGGSAYGTAEAHLLSEGVKISRKSKNVRLKRLTMSIFPPYSTMKQNYKYLKKLPVLLPFSWLCRAIEILFHPKRFITQRKKLKTLSSENIDAYQNELDFVGIDFNFE